MTKTIDFPYGAGSADVVELDISEPAHGGWCVARTPGEGKVVFVRHALPGERVLARVTSSTSKFARADVVEVLTPSPDRVQPPCQYARPGGCGGCDLQHASPAAQRAIKAQVVSQQLHRIAGIDRQVTVEALPLEAWPGQARPGQARPGQARPGEPLPGEAENLGWRTRVSFAVGRDGTAGLRRHRSREIVPVQDCLIAHQLVREAGVPAQRWPGAKSVDVAVSPAAGERSVRVSGRAPRAGEQSRPWLTQHAAGREWRVSTGVFWQVHPAAADVLTSAVLAALDPQPGDVALDLYCGAGLFAGALAAAVGPDGQVIAVESDTAAVRDARKNLARFPQARIHRGDAAEVLGQRGAGQATLAVLDPPRAGAPRALIELLAGLERVAYVSCDPATLARDIAVFAGLGWQLEDLRAFDAFPMTHHVECLAVLRPAG
jgi:tRNA/tmRNA/rRNA uracil-C5-methylase (TrmA/RlmC/RlmD family)